MAQTLQSHLSVLSASASLYASLPAFRVPRSDLQSGEPQDWEPVTYAQFERDVELYARHWARVLKRNSIPQRSVIGMWIGGLTYTDVLQIYGLSRAGFVPQLFSIRLPNPVIIYELLEKANSKGLIFDSSFKSAVEDCPLPTYPAVNIDETDTQDEPLPVLSTVIDPDDVLFVFHTSGSTSNSPKLVPCTRKWVNAAILKSRIVGKPKVDGSRDVTVWMGSMSHIGQSFMFLGSMQHGACTIQPTKINFSPDELAQMITRCGLNRLNQFAAFLAMMIRNSRQNPKLLSLLRSLDEILYSGLQLPRDEEQFAYANGLKLKNLFGNTECGAMLLSVGGTGPTASLLCALDTTSYAFFPITSNQSEAGHKSTTSQMVELVILSDSGDCPHPSLRASDGHFHTGDLFLEVQPNSYVFRGRDDDWIKSENSLRCDTKAIEDNVRLTCSELISDCIVVGNGRPSPVLFVEPASDGDHTKLKREILRRTRQFHSRRYLHERITSATMIVVVERGSLPRTTTKGNIRRKAVEEIHKGLLDRIHGVAF